MDYFIARVQLRQRCIIRNNQIPKTQSGLRKRRLLIYALKEQFRLLKR
jgi:hypothetical protein